MLSYSGLETRLHWSHSRLPGESHMSEQPLFSPVGFQWLCNQMQSARGVAAVKLLTFKANIVARNEWVNHISHKKVIKIDTLNMKICWVFMKISIIFKLCGSLWHVKKSQIALTIHENIFSKSFSILILRKHFLNELNSLKIAKKIQWSKELKVCSMGVDTMIAISFDVYICSQWT